MRWRSIARTLGAPASSATIWSSQIFSTRVRGLVSEMGLGFVVGGMRKLLAFRIEAREYQRRRSGPPSAPLGRPGETSWPDLHQSSQQGCRQFDEAWSSTRTPPAAPAEGHGDA